MWIFGYGSLVWKVDFPFEERVIGYIKGYVRRFWQASIDHRGTPEKPGRVVTLIKTGNPKDIVGGMAYKLFDEDKEKVLSHLDYREKGGYERLSITFYPRDSSLDEQLLTIYVGTEDNPFYTGTTEEADISKIIHNSHGPSGDNIEYLFKLAEAMDAFGFSDDHLSNLKTLVQDLMDKS